MPNYCKCNNKYHRPSLHDKKCKPRGSTDARVLIVGMAPGHDEAKQGRYFVGSSGKQLNRDLLAAGIPKDDVRFQNVAHYWPRNHKLSNLTQEQRYEGFQALLSDIAENDYDVIVPVGDDALKALTGRTRITKWRGSKLELHPDVIALCGGEMESPLVLPTLHPSAVLQGWDYHVLFTHDLKTLSAYLNGVDIFPPARSLIIRGDDDYEQRCKEIVRHAKAGDVISADIEVFQGSLACVSFGVEPEWGIAVHADDREVWQEVLESHAPKVWHNSMYDLTFLEAKCGVKPKGTQHDTQLMWHALYPELACSKLVGKSLALLASIFTNENYYKDALTTWRKVADWDAFYRYGARDGAVTIEVYNALKSMLDDAPSDLNAAYYRMLQVVQPFKDASIRGVKVDTKTKGVTAATTKKRLDKLEAELESIVGKGYNPNSWQQVKKYLKGEGINVPNTQETTLVAKLAELRTEEDESDAREFLELQLEYRKLKKAYGTYYTFSHDDDGRLRPSWNVGGTETGRLSSSGSIIFNSNVNFQTLPRPARQFIVADKGYKLVYADLAQAEARIVAYLAGCEPLIEAFESGNDPYKMIAGWMYNKTPDEIDSEERYLAKRCVLGLLYGMGWKTWKDQMNTDKGFKYMSAARAKELIDLFFSKFPEIRQYHGWIEDQVKRDSNLSTIFGRRRWFRKRYGRYTAGTMREAYDYIPQSMVPDIINNGILALETYNPEIQLIGQIHDAWMGQIRDNEHFDANLRIVREALSYPITLFDINGKQRKFTIPVDLEVGQNWRDYDEDENPNGLKEVTL